MVSVDCQDEVDEAVLASLYSAGGARISPTHVMKQPELSRCKLDKWHITDRLQRMNKRIMKELGKRVAENVGKDGP